MHACMNFVMTKWVPIHRSWLSTRTSISIVEHTSNQNFAIDKPQIRKKMTKLWFVRIVLNYKLVSSCGAGELNKRYCGFINFHYFRNLKQRSFMKCLRRSFFIYGIFSWQLLKPIFNNFFKGLLVHLNKRMRREKRIQRISFCSLKFILVEHQS